MHYYFLTLLTLTATAIANPFFEPKANDALQTLTKRVVSPDETYGGTNGNTCPPENVAVNMATGKSQDPTAETATDAFS